MLVKEPFHHIEPTSNKKSWLFCLLWCRAGVCGKQMCQCASALLTRPEKSLQCGRIILPQVYTLFLILNTVYICFGDETDVSNAGEQLTRDKSPGDEVIRF